MSFTLFSLFFRFGLNSDTPAPYIAMQLGLIQEVVPWECKMNPISRPWWWVLDKE